MWRAHPHPQIRLARVDLSLQYALNESLFFEKLKVTRLELMAITHMTSTVWATRTSDIAPHMQCACALAYMTSHAHQHWLAEAMGMS